tara:strand:+ start:1021 stop:9870 length:8850 start_codon:yes stop_codon:yes gene_type:complete
MADNLTSKFKEELEKRSKTQSSITSPNIPSANLWDNLGRDAYNPDDDVLPDFGPLKGIAAGLWTFADTATFGFLGLADEKLGWSLEDAMWDEENAWAKWGSAFGGLAGFVSGAPLRVGLKIASKAAPTAARMAGLSKKTKFMDKVTNTMTSKGVKAGLGKKEAEQITNLYSNLHQKSRYTADIAKNWTKHSNKLMDDILQQGVGAGKLSATEANAVRQMFKGNMGRRPVADLIDVVMETGKFANPKTGFIVGNMINEAVAFGVIDAVFEATRSYKEGEDYDWTAPIWGVGIGSAFGALKMLPAAGKASPSSKDFVTGLRTAFDSKYTNFEKFKGKQLYQKAEGHGAMLKHYGENAFVKQDIDGVLRKKPSKPWIVKVAYKGSKKNKKHMWFNLTKASQYSKYPSISDEALESMTREALGKSTRDIGGQLIRAAIADEGKTMLANIKPMIGGALIMNARTLYEMHQGADPDINDILPHALIGAWINRRGNPSAWDMSPARMEALRNNLNFLGISVPNLHNVPDFRAPVHSSINPMKNNPNLEATREKMREMEHTTPDVDVLFSPLTAKEKGETSVQMDNSETARIYKAVHAYSAGLDRHQRPLDDIPMSDAKEVVDLFKKASKKDGFEVRDETDAYEYLEEQSWMSTENMLESFTETPYKISEITNEFSLPENEAQLRSKTLPEINISEKLNEEITKDDSYAQDATEMVDNTITKVNMLFEHLRRANVVDDKIPLERKQANVTTLDQFKKIKEFVDEVEEKFSVDLPKGQKFDIVESFPALQKALLHNFARKATRGTGEFFDRTNPGFDELKGHFGNVFFGARGDLTKQKLIPDVSNKHIKITDSPPGEEVNARSILGAALDIFSAKGQFEVLPPKKTLPDESGYEPYFEVPYSKVMSIKEFLSSKGLIVGEKSLTPFHNEIVYSILRERIKGSSLTARDVAGLNTYMSMGSGYASFKPASKGEAAGWTISKIDMIKIPENIDDPVYRLAVATNEKIDSIIKNSETYDKNGKKLGKLVKPSSEPLTIINEQELIAANNALNISHGDYNAKQMMLNMLNVMNPAKYGNYIEQMHRMIQSPGGHNAALLQAYLETSGVLTRNKKNQITPSKDHIELMNDTKVMEEISKKIELETGSSLKDIEANIQHIAQRVENTMSGFEDVAKASKMTMSKFFDTYKVKDGPGHEYEKQLNYINNILFDTTGNVESWTRKDTGVKNLIDNIYVKYNDKDTLVKDIPYKESRDEFYKEIQSDVIGLIKTRVESKNYHVLHYDGSIREDTATVIDNGSFDALWSRGMKPVLASGEVTKLVPTAFDSGTVRRYFNIFEAFAANLNPDIANPLKVDYNNFEELLKKQDKFFKGTEAEMDTGGGAILFHTQPNATPFILARKDLPNLEKAYIEFSKDLNAAIERGDLQLPLDRLANIEEINQSMLGGKLKKGEKVKIISNEDTKETPFAHEFIVEGYNPDDLSKVKLSIDPEVDLSIKINKEIDTFLKQVTTDGISREFLEPTGGNRTPSPDDYKTAMRYWKNYEWLLGTSNDWSRVEEAFSARDVTKMLSRMKLYETKNFGKEQRDIFKGLPLESDQQRQFDRFEDGSNVMIFDDNANYDVKDYVQQQLKNLKLTWDSVLGERSSDSAYDSIAYASKDQMQYLSFIHGFKNWKTNSILKPVISSTGENYLMGKTLFVYDPYLDSYLKNNNIDILLTNSGSKLLSTNWEINAADFVPTNSKKQELSKYIKKISSNSIGVKSENFQDTDLAKQSVSNYNYMDSLESQSIFNRDYADPLDKALSGLTSILESPVHVNQFIRQSYKDEDSVQAMAGNHSIATAKVGALRAYNNVSDVAYAMDISPRMVYNKLYKHFIDPIINSKSVMRSESGYTNKSIGRFGGKAPLIQSLNPKYNNLKGTIVTRDGELKQIGEIVLRDADRDSLLSELLKDGYQLRFVDNKNARIVKSIDGINEDFWTESINNGWTLGDVHSLLKGRKDFDLKDEFDYSVAVMVNRYPRTRPNDVTFLALRDFLEKEMGNGIIINPYDVLNVFEGDYDADKADYYFMHRETMADHVSNNLVNNWVQSIEPQDKVNNNTALTLGKLNSTDENKLFQKGIGTDLINSKVRGLGQTMPRLLNHLTHLSEKITRKMIDGDKKLKQIEDQFKGSGYVLENKHILMTTKKNKGRETEYIILDFDDTKVHHRLGLNAQTMLDAGAKDTGMFDEPGKWAKKVFFGDVTEDINTMSNLDDFAKTNNYNDIETGKKGRPRIFRKLIVNKDGVKEEYLNIVEQELFQSVMQNHGRFLQLIPGIFERSGERRQATFEDIWQKSDDYFNFYQDMGTSLYNRLKNKESINEDKDSSDILKKMFGVKSFRKTSIIKGTKKKKKETIEYSTKSPFDSNKRLLQKAMYEGRSGHVVDQIFHRIWRKNIFEDKPINRKLTGQERKLLDDATETFMHSTDFKNPEERRRSIGLYIDNVKETVRDINKSINMIHKLKRKAKKIKWQKITDTFTTDIRDGILEGIESSIKSIEQDYGKFISRKYHKTKRIADIGEGIKYKSLEKNKDLREGAIQMYTLNALSGIDWEHTYGKNNIELNENVKILKSLEAKYFSEWMGNRDASKTSFAYGVDETLLNTAEKQFLQNLPDRATFEEVRDEILQKGYDRWGMPYIYKYASPSLDKMTIGVFNNTPVPVPFKSSNRYKTMLNFITKKSIEHESVGTNHWKITMNRLARISHRYRSLLEDNTGMIPHEHPQWNEYVTMMKRAGEIIHDDVGFQNHQFPSLHKDFVSSYKRYNNIKFDINRSGFTDPILISNNHVLNFYRDLFKASKYEEDFKDLEDRISNVTALQMEGRIIDPMSYLATMNSIEGDLVPKINKILNEGNFSLLDNSLEAQRLRNNPLWSALGGSKGIIGKEMSFEPINRLSKANLDLYSKLVKQGRDIKEIRDDNIKMDEIRNEWRCSTGDLNE